LPPDEEKKEKDSVNPYDEQMGQNSQTTTSLVIKLVLGATILLKDLGVASQFILQQANVIHS
jgi:hypothetical protein